MSFFKGFKAGFSDFGHNIATIINTVLLLIVYLLGVGITSIIAKLSNKQFLQIGKKKTSYWDSLNLKKRKIEYYYRQF